MQTSEVLNAAADLIEERGWVQYDGWILPNTPEGAPVCLEGGIQAAAGFTLPQKLTEASTRELVACPAYRAVAAYLEVDDDLFIWNDRRDRTAGEVVEVLRACAVIEESRERQPVEAVA